MVTFHSPLWYLNTKGETGQIRVMQKYQCLFQTDTLLHFISLMCLKHKKHRPVTPAARWPALLYHRGLKLNRVIIGVDNGLSPDRHQDIAWTNADVLSIGPSGKNFSEISVKLPKFSFKKCISKCRLQKSRPSCSDLCVNLASLLHGCPQYFSMIKSTRGKVHINKGVFRRERSADNLARRRFMKLDSSQSRGVHLLFEKLITKSFSNFHHSNHALKYC